MDLEKFLEKSSSIFCSGCGKKIKESNFKFCLGCENIYDISCSIKHKDENNNPNFNESSMNDFCFEHKENFITKCRYCDLLFCKNCDPTFHINNMHPKQQISQALLSNKDFNIIKTTFEKQKTIFEKIKEINNNFINSLENDIKIKETIINNYQYGKSKNINSIENLKNLYIKNDEKYEKEIQKYFNKIDKKENYSNYEEIFVNEIILPFIYSLMINENKTLNEKLLNIMKSQFNDLCMKNKVNNNNNNNSVENNKIENNNELLNKRNEQQNLEINNNNKDDLNIDNNEDNYENNTLIRPIMVPTFANAENISSSNKNMSNEEILITIKNNSKENKVIEQDESSGLKSSSKERKKRGKQKKSESKEKLKSEEENSENTDEDRNFICNMILLESGNFAISNEGYIGIYNLKKIKDSDNKDIDRNKYLIQKIPLHKITGGKMISHISEFPDKTLLCSVYAEIIRIKLINQDKDHEIIGKIKLNEEEITRKMISLGNSLLVILSDINNDCFIKIYNKNDEPKMIIQNRFLNIDNILNSKNNISDNLIEIDSSFININNNLNDMDIIWQTLFALKEDNDISNYHEFIATSNAENVKGRDLLVFFGIKKDVNNNNFNIIKIKEINQLSCSVESNSICQLNDQYLCIGLSDFNRKKQTGGFAIIDIKKREFVKKIKGDNISSIYYDKEKSLIISSMEILKKRCFVTRIYKVINNEENEENKKIEFKCIDTHTNRYNNIIISIYKIPNDSKDDNIFITSSYECELETIKTSI